VKSGSREERDGRMMDPRDKVRSQRRFAASRFGAKYFERLTQQLTPQNCAG